MINLMFGSDCCGCAACAQRCPNDCIEMKKNDQGFLFPVVDESKCIKCKQCELVCPINRHRKYRKPICSYALINTDERIRAASSSGGVFSLLAEKVIKNGGVVFGAKFDSEWNVIHSSTESIDGLQVFRGSKYVQSAIGNCFKDVESFLKQGRQVLFTGTPCQVAGLKCFLGKDIDRLLLVDLACHGAPSPDVWHSYLNDTFLSEDSIRAISFRDKSLGWKNYSFKIDSNKGMHVEVFRDNLFMKGFLSDLYLRPSCYNCHVKLGKGDSDMTIADYWGVQRLNPELDDDKGTSLVIIHTQKGHDFLKSIEVDLNIIDLDEALIFNEAIKKSVKKPWQYNLFWSYYHSRGIAAIDYSLNRKPSILFRLIRKIKSFR